MGRGVVAVVLLAGCGRVGFDGPGADDARGGDATGDAPDGAPACLPSYRVCDGFEAPSLAPIWTALGGVSLDAAVAHRGGQSVKFHAGPTVAGANNYVQLVETTSLAAADPTLFVRAWVRLGALPLNNMGLISAQQSGSNPREVALFVLPDALGVYTQFTDQSQHNNTLPPTNTWFCVVWKVVRATGNTGAVYLAGDQPPAELVDVPTDGTPALVELDLGVQLAGSTNTVSQAAFDLWIDDVIVSPSQVTCAD